MNTVFIPVELFQKICIDWRRCDSVCIILALESIITKARYHVRGMNFAEAA